MVKKLFSLISSLNTATGIVQTYKNLRGIYDDATEATNFILGSGDHRLFKQSGRSVAETQQDIVDMRGDVERLSHKGIFYVEIERVAPAYSSNRAAQISRRIQSVSITHEGYESQEVNVGSAYYNHITGTQSSSLDITFLEFNQGYVMDFLTRVSPMNIDGIDSGIESEVAMYGLKLAKEYIPSISSAMSLFGVGDRVGLGEILPRDGTFLLPHDWYFRIKVYTVENDYNNKIQKRNYVVNDDFLLEGSPSTSFGVGDDGFRELQANFKPLKSW